MAKSRVGWREQYWPAGDGGGKRPTASQKALFMSSPSRPFVPLSHSCQASLAGLLPAALPEPSSPSAAALSLGLTELAMSNGHHRELGDHPSPFASGRATSGAAADAAAAVENDAAFPAADASEAGQSTSFAWAGAWEEVAEAPAIAAAYSSTLSAYAIAQQQVVVEPAEAEGLKAADVACALPGWRCEVVRLLALALPIAASGHGVAVRWENLSAAALISILVGNKCGSHVFLGMQASCCAAQLHLGRKTVHSY